MTECLDEEAILSFCRGSMAAAERPRVEAHIAECDECRALVSAVARSSLAPRPAAPSVALAADPAMAPTTPAQGGFGPSAAPRAASTPPRLPVREGDLLAGKYAVERVLGAGGMGVVVAARHTQLDQRFALKFLLPAACEAPGAIARFLREGKAAARITSEHVARVVDTGVLDDGSPYLVMEYLEGADLGVVTEERGRIPAAEAIEYVLQACEAIVEAHQLGIVHRDLKPANLFLARRKDGSPLVKVLDFGISKADEGSQTQLTSTSMLMGSPRYMSPEQMVSAKDVDARTDVWALGVILFELVTGRPVWQADTVQGLCALIATSPAPALRPYAPDAPAGLEAVIHRCLAKAPSERLASIADLATALGPIAPPSAHTSIERILRVAGRTQSSTPGAGAMRAPVSMGAAAPMGAGGMTAGAAPTAPGVSMPPVAAAAAGARGSSSSARFVLLLGAGIGALAIAGLALNAIVLRRDPAERAATAAESASAPPSALAPPEPALAPSSVAADEPVPASSAPSAVAETRAAATAGAPRTPGGKASPPRPRPPAAPASDAAKSASRPETTPPSTSTSDPPNRALSDRK
ncbi:MAG: protein kinase [Labilithrix sp.]|nr:protein kinase [Labilithrix sp.]